MSIYSDHKCGAISDEEFRNACIRQDRRERYYAEREEYFTARDEYLKANDYDDERADDYDGD